MAALSNGRIQPERGSDRAETCHSRALRDKLFERALKDGLWPRVPVRGQRRQRPWPAESTSKVSYLARFRTHAVGHKSASSSLAERRQSIGQSESRCKCLLRSPAQRSWPTRVVLRRRSHGQPLGGRQRVGVAIAEWPPATVSGRNPRFMK